MKKHILTMVILFIVLNFSDCSFIKKTEPEHYLYVSFPRAAFLEEPDTLDIYKGNGELICSISTEGKYGEKIAYHELKYSEVVTIYSHYLDETAEFETIEGWNKDALGAGEAPMTDNEINTFDVGMYVDYENGEFEATWGSGAYYDWIDGFYEINLSVVNYEKVSHKNLTVLLSSTSHEDGYYNIAPLGTWESYEILSFTEIEPFIVPKKYKYIEIDVFDEDIPEEEGHTFAEEIYDLGESNRLDIVFDFAKYIE